MSKGEVPGPWFADYNAMLEMLLEIQSRLALDAEKGCGCDVDYVDGRMIGSPCVFHRIERDLARTIAKAAGTK